MTAANFQTWYDFCEAPDNDGQPFHITEGDPGGATVYGWTYVMWQRVAPLHGIKDVSLNAFKAQTKATLEPLSRATYWNMVQADRLPSGIDLFWTDFQFGSGGATRVLQTALGWRASGAIGSGSLAFLTLEPNLQGLLDKFLAARMAYYDQCGFHTKWPGLYRRAKVSHVLASSLIAKPVPPLSQAERPSLAA